MKQLYILAAALLASTATFAQTAIWNGDGANTAWWGDGSPSVVENPDKSGINTSDNCLKFTMTNDSKVVKLKFSTTTDFSFNGSRRVSLMIKKTKNTNVNIELSDPTDGSDGYWQKAAAWYGGEGTWQKLVFDFSTHSINDYAGLISITASTDGVEGPEDVYIDNIVVEDVAKVNGTALTAIEDGTLTGALTLTGAWMKGDCQNTNGEWQKVEYNDFALLAKKLTATTTSINMRGTVLKDAYNAFGEINPNIIIYADNAFDENNVVANGTIASLNLNEAYAFAAPEAFTAQTVKLARSLQAGINTACLPFATTAEEQGATVLATFDAVNGEKVNFTKADNVSANVPFITTNAAASEGQEFANKEIVSTPASLGDTFYGVYAPTSATGKYGITGEGKFAKGGESATVNAFHALLSLDETGEAKSFLLTIDGETTGIQNIEATPTSEQAVYNLQGMRVNGKQAKGLLIVNGRKVLVK